MLLDLPFQHAKMRDNEEPKTPMIGAYSSLMFMYLSTVDVDHASFERVWRCRLFTSLHSRIFDFMLRKVITQTNDAELLHMVHTLHSRFLEFNVKIRYTYLSAMLVQPGFACRH